ncbi:hypothetical protein C1X69_16990 [Pseudomonas sp. FW305-67]|nr:hypothetical protein C1X67_15330 [Pseudomonas sp. FW305-62]PNA84522.1 hypothetical protein C1X66_19760 [Pseudomonas sp. MPR-R3B]PNB19860.1 hypothetical protein C1X69_16990 [Pseudomonas sp. FW305-67]
MARGLAPVGARSGPYFFLHVELSELRLLRSRTGASPLATGSCLQGCVLPVILRQTDNTP